MLAGEVGGRFSTETTQFLRDLAWAKTRGVSELQPVGIRKILHHDPEYRTLYV